MSGVTGGEAHFDFTDRPWTRRLARRYAVLGFLAWEMAALGITDRVKGRLQTGSLVALLVVIVPGVLVGVVLFRSFSRVSVTVDHGTVTIQNAFARRTLAVDRMAAGELFEFGPRILRHVCITYPGDGDKRVFSGLLAVPPDGMGEFSAQLATLAQAPDDQPPPT